MRPPLIYIHLNQVMGMATVPRFSMSGIFMEVDSVYSAMCSGPLPMEDESKSPDMSS